MTTSTNPTRAPRSTVDVTARRGLFGRGLLLLGCLCSCGPSTNRNAERRDDPPLLSSEPLGSYVAFATQDEALVASVIDREFRRCMLRNGFDIPEVPPGAGDSGRRNPFEFTPPRAENGYGGADEEESENLQTWSQQLDEASFEAFYLAAFGPEPTGTLPVIDAADPGDTRTVLPRRLGCDGEATNAVVGDYASFESVRLQLQAAYNASASRALEDARLRDEVDAWHECMEQEGYEMSAPEDAPARSLDLAPDEQVRLATVDAQCRESSSYNRVGTQLMRSYQLDWVNENVGVLEEYEQLRADAISRARDLLED